MPTGRITRSTPVLRTARVQQVEGMFELPPTERSESISDVSLPFEERAWNVGLVVGPSGSGKSTLVREMFSDALVTPFKWPRERSVLDAFPADLSIKEITELLSSVGFSTPPSWLRPFYALSNGEQFRVTIAHALAERRDLTVVDEFTSVVDRNVAQIASVAIARLVRRRQQRFIAVSCHYDIIDWLNPDWVYQTDVARFDWRTVQRPPAVTLRVFRVDKEAWRIFRHTHYLDTSLALGAKCFMAEINGMPAAFVATISFPHAVRPGWRLHRLVCLPDYQGVGIGVKLSDYVSGLFRATGKPVFRTLSHPAVIRHCAKSPVWKMIRTPSRVPRPGTTSSVGNLRTAHDRITAGFEYVGPSYPDDARRFGLL